jgi:hypothetical protein
VFALAADDHAGRRATRSASACASLHLMAIVKPVVPEVLTPAVNPFTATLLTLLYPAITLLMAVWALFLFAVFEYVKLP